MHRTTSSAFSSAGHDAFSMADPCEGLPPASYNEGDKERNLLDCGETRREIYTLMIIDIMIIDIMTIDSRIAINDYRYNVGLTQAMHLDCQKNL